MTARRAGLAPVLALAALIAGLPAALYLAGGSPVPHAVPSWHQVAAVLMRRDDGTLFLAAVRYISWLAWAAFTISAVVEAVSRARGRAAPRLPLIAPFQAVAAALIGVTVLTSLQVPRAGHRSWQPVQAALTASAAVTGPLVPGQRARAAVPAPAARAPQAGDGRGAPAPRVYRVVPGDDLWAIAARFLGSGERWHEIFRLNAGKPQPDGLALTHPSLIYPGWVLLLPPHGGHPGSAARPARPGSGRPGGACAPAPAPSRTRQRERPGAPSPSRPGAHSRPVAVQLPSGALIGISVAIMVAAALTLASIQRRRRYRPRAGLAASLQPGVPPLPAVITALRRAARPAPPAEDAGPDPGAPAAADPYLDLYDDTSPGPGQRGDRVPGGRPAPGPEPPGQAGTRAAPAGTARPGARAPGMIPLGVRGTSEAALDIAALGGLGLTGPGAPAAARAVLAALLAQARPAQAGMPPAIIIPAADAARLLPGEDAAGIPGVSVPASLQAALDEMEAAILRQARTTAAFDAGDDPQATASAAGTPGPGTALIAACGPGTTRRLRGILESGRGLGAAAILLGPWQPGVTCQVAADGMITGVTPPGAGLEGIRLFSLGAAEAAAITAVLRDARGTPPAAPAPARAASPPARHPAGIPRETRPAAGAPCLPAPAIPAPGRTRTADGPPEPAPPAAATPAPAAAAPGTARPVQLTMLGPLRITAAGQEIGGGLRKARELMAFLAVHPDGASGEAISEALWPGSGASHAAGQRNLALRKSRDMLRSATGLPAPMWIIHASGRYRLDPGLISTDLWQFSAALDEARHAGGDDARLAACRKAAGLYHGELAEGAGYDWAEPHTETARRRALDAWTTIAQILQPRDPDQALAALESALRHDPYNEFLYQKIMRLQAAAGRPEAVRRTLRLLESRLTELGITPGAQTRQVAASLLGTGPAPHRPPAGPAPLPQPHERRGTR